MILLWHQSYDVVGPPAGGSFSGNLSDFIDSYLMWSSNKLPVNLKSWFRI